MAEIESSTPYSSGERCAGLVIMVGTPGSGKSYLGRALSDALGALLLQTDAVRKEMFPEPRYTPEEARAVYDECHRRCARALAQGRRVVFDGTNLRERHRQTLYDIADRAKAPAVVVVTYAPEATIRTRLRQRAENRDPHDQSDADWTVYRTLRRQAEPVCRPHVVVNTTTRPGPVIRLLRRELAR